MFSPRGSLLRYDAVATQNVPNCILLLVINIKYFDKNDSIFMYTLKICIFIITLELDNTLSDDTLRYFKIRLF